MRTTTGGIAFHPPKIHTRLPREHMLEDPDHIVVPFPMAMASIPVATEVRATVLMAGLQALQQHGWLDAYKRAAPTGQLETIQTAVIGSWLPMDLATSHYQTCDSLGVSVLEQLEIGGAVVTRLQQTLLGTLAKVARATGAVNPLSVLRRFNELHARSWVGSAGRVVALGPKDLRLDVVGLPLVRIPYFRTSYRGFLRAGLQLVSAHAFVTEVPSVRVPNAISYKLSWV